MDCKESVDDYCAARQAHNLKIPENIPSADDHDQFFIVFEVETLVPTPHEEEEEEEEEEEGFVEVEERSCHTFWAACPRKKSQNLTRERISEMLSKAGVPGHKQEFMVERISRQADAMANADSNRGKRVLPMIVTISIVACLCLGESVHD